MEDVLKLTVLPFTISIVVFFIKTYIFLIQIRLLKPLVVLLFFENLHLST